MILLIDNFDSFTYNLYQYFSEAHANVEVIRNNEITVEKVNSLQPEVIIISPGPGLPKDHAICIDIVHAFYQSVPIIGICLGQQIIAEAFGAALTEAKNMKHGKTSFITHNNTGPFSYLSQPLEVMRYHSFVVDNQSMPESLEITATSLDDDEIMAIQHRNYPVFGLQFHPESIGSTSGKQMIQNLLREVREEFTV
ncbi:aminodeoxychorismate/anthranilate synthase component II [Virgibacillus oceani]